MSWWYLSAAILLEVSGITCMKLADGFTKPVPSVLVFVFYVLSFICLSQTLREIEVSVAYAVWSGLGTAVIAVIGVVVFSESMTPTKILSLVMIIAGVVGLNLTGKGAHP